MCMPGKPVCGFITSFEGKLPGRGGTTVSPTPGNTPVPAAGGERHRFTSADPYPIPGQGGAVGEY